jgi:hypothetical protein
MNQSPDFIGLFDPEFGVMIICIMLVENRELNEGRLPELCKVGVRPPQLEGARSILRYFWS